MASRGSLGQLGYLRLLSTPTVRGLWVAQVQSVLGDRLYALAMMWLIWQVTHSALLMGLSAVLESVPYVVLGTVGRALLAPFVSLHRLALVDVLRAVVVGIVPILWGRRGTEVAALLAAACLLGVLGAVFDPNLAAFVPELAGPDQVQQVTGLMDLTGRLARVAGPGAAGLLLLAVPAVGLYAFDAATFALSAAALFWIARYAGPAATGSAGGKREQQLPRAGSLLLRSPQLMVVIAMHGAGILASTVPAIAMPVLLTVRLHASGSGYGLVMAAAGMGALAGNPLASNMRLGPRFPAVYFVGWIATGLTLAATGQARSLAMVALLAFAGGLVTPVAAISLRTHLAQRFAGPERLAIMAADQAVIRAAGTGGMLVLPALAAADPGAGFMIAGLSTAVVAIAGLAVTARLSGSAGAVPSEQPAPAGNT